MRPRNTLLLLVVLAALGAYLYWVELPQQKTEVEQKRLVTLDKDGVTGLTLAYPEQTIVLEKTADGHWRLTQPLEADGDDMAVKNLIGMIADAQVTRTLDDVGDKLASYGLAPPEATVTLTTKDGATAIKVGKTTQVGSSAYVQKGDEPKVYITGAVLQSGVKKQVKDLRDKMVVTFDDADVRKVELRRPDGAIVIERNAEGDGWTIVEPKRYPADPAEVRAFLAGVRGIRAEDFPSDEPNPDLARYGLDKPRLTITTWLGKDQAQKTVAIGAAQDGDKKLTYAKRGERGTVYAIPEYTLKNLEKDLTTLRDKTVLTLDKTKAAKVTVTRKDGAGFTLVKRGDTWHLETAGEGVEREPTIARFVEDAVGLKGNEIAAEDHPDLGKYGLATPDITVAVADEGGTALATLIATRGAATGPEPKSFVASADGGIVYGVKPFVYDRIDKKLADFREAPATPLPSGVATPPADAPQLGDEDGAAEDEELDAGDDEDAE